MRNHVLTVGLFAIFFMTAGCGGARPYSVMYKSASSELSAPAQARDHRLKADLRAALISEQGLAGLPLSPEVLMERGYVIGHVDTPEQAAAIQRIARGISGLRSVDVYLPITQSHSKNDSGASAEASTISDMAIHTEIATALRLAPGVVASRINVTVLDRRAVLLGVVSSDEERHHAVEAVSGVKDVNGVTNWLLLPEPNYMAVRPKLR